MGRRFAVHAGAHGKALIALVLASATASATPKRVEAKVEFDRGVAAYKKGDYATASDALASSFALEADAETLFAWAQTERKAGHCDKAVELYTKLLAFDLPAANKKAVNVQIKECKAILAKQKPKEPEQKPEPEPKVARAPNAEPAKPTPAPAPPATVAASEPAEPPEPIAQPAPHEQRVAWWKDPIGGALVGGGVVALGAGITFLVQGHNADQDKIAARSYADFVAAADRAESRGRLGVIFTIVGVGLVGGGVYRYATHESHATTMTGWLAPHGGGIAVGGRF